MECLVKFKLRIEIEVYFCWMGDIIVGRLGWISIGTWVILIIGSIGLVSGRIETCFREMNAACFIKGSWRIRSLGISSAALGTCPLNSLFIFIFGSLYSLMTQELQLWYQCKREQAFYKRDSKSVLFFYIIESVTI